MCIALHFRSTSVHGGERALPRSRERICLVVDCRPGALHSTIRQLNPYLYTFESAYTYLRADNISLEKIMTNAPVTPFIRLFFFSWILHWLCTRKELKSKYNRHRTESGDMFLHPEKKKSSLFKSAQWIPKIFLETLDILLTFCIEKPENPNLNNLSNISIFFVKNWVFSEGSNQFFRYYPSKLNSRSNHVMVGWWIDFLFPSVFSICILIHFFRNLAISVVANIWMWSMCAVKNIRWTSRECTYHRGVDARLKNFSLNGCKTRCSVSVSSYRSAYGVGWMLASLRSL